MHSMRHIVTAAALFASAPLAFGSAEIVDNFRLTDQQGTSHELYYLSDMKAVVLLAQGTGCDASQKAAATIEGLRAKYERQGVTFLLLDSNLQDAASREALAGKAKQAGIGLPILMDEAQLVGEALGITRNGEVLIANPQGWKVAYRGGVGAVPAALDSLIAGGTVKSAASEVAGCAIKMDKQQAHASISYEKTIAPMLIDKCVACHRTGGIGPWQMTNYDMIKGFSPMIREVVRTERMPPWHADPHYSVFSNDRSLNKEEIKTLVHWIEAGSPRGTGGDPLAELKKSWPEWSLGEPDLIVEIPAFDVPATGTIPYQMPSATNPLDHDVWVRAVDFQPGDRTVLHHIIATMGADGSGIREGGSLGGYVPGAGPMVLPTETGILMKKDAKFFFQMHYTATGKPARDVSRMGLYFRKDAPEYQFRSAVMAKPSLKIPPNTKAHTESASRTFDRDIIVYSLLPHSHFRGTASNFVATYPDGTTETLLSVPHYDFNWQTTYELTTPKRLPAGTKITHSTTWDNSSQNKANPDPNREVPWGQQTWDEMLYGVVRFRYVDEASAPKATVSSTRE